MHRLHIEYMESKRNIKFNGRMATILALSSFFTMTLLAIIPYTALAQNNTNWVGSVPLSSAISKLIKSNTHITLVNAVEKALNDIGTNSTATSATLTIQRGFLVYNISVADSTNNTHIVLVDAGNGKILVNQKIRNPSLEATNESAQLFK